MYLIIRSSILPLSIFFYSFLLSLLLLCYSTVFPPLLPPPSPLFHFLLSYSCQFVHTLTSTHFRPSLPLLCSFLLFSLLSFLPLHIFFSPLPLLLLSYHNAFIFISLSSVFISLSLSSSSFLFLPRSLCFFLLLVPLQYPDTFCFSLLLSFLHFLLSSSPCCHSCSFFLSLFFLLLSLYFSLAPPSCHFLFLSLPFLLLPPSNTMRRRNRSKFFGTKRGVGRERPEQVLVPKVV